MLLTVALDFDGTVVLHKKYFTYDLNYKLFANCKKVLHRLHKKGVNFVLNTSRTGIRRLLAILYIKVYKLPIQTRISSVKPVADIYIDDKNLECDKIDWKDIEKKILKRLEGECIISEKDLK